MNRWLVSSLLLLLERMSDEEWRRIVEWLRQVVSAYDAGGPAAARRAAQDGVHGAQHQNK